MSLKALGLQCKRGFYYEKARLGLLGLPVLNSDTTTVWNNMRWFVPVTN